MEAVSNVEEGNNLGLATSEEEEEFFDAVEEQEPLANFNVPLSIFHYKDYNSDFFTSWYNISSEIFKETNRTCPEKKILNLALSVLMLPYIAFTALGLVVCSRFQANSKTQDSVGEDKTKKSETGVPKRLAYGVLAAIAIFVNMAVLVALVVPATIALATFYLLNRDLSHSLVTALKISMGRYSNKHQNIEVSFHEKEVTGPNIAWDMEIEFPPQFKRLLRDLYENENNKWFDVTRNSEHSIVLKLSTNINLKNGLKPLRNEIKDVLATSIQEFAKTMEELIKLEKKEITYDKLKELLNEFKSKVVDSIGPNLTSHLIQSAYQVAFIQAIKFQRDRRGEDFSLEDEIKNSLVRQELESLRGIGQTRCNNIYKKLKEIHENSSLTNDTLKRGLEDLFKFEYDDQEIERRLIKSVMKKVQGKLSQSDIPDKEKQSLRKQLEDLEKKVKVPSDKEASAKINDFIEKMYLEIKKYKVQRLLREQKKGVLRLCKKLRKYGESGLAEIIEAFRVQDEGHLEKSTLEQTLKDQNKRLQAEQNNREKGHPGTRSIEVLLKRNEEILKALKQLELGKKELLINEETKNDYKEELTSREKIKFAVIEDDLLKVFKLETFDEKEIKKLLERAELEYCLAEKRIKYPVIKTKDNIKHFSQNLLSPLIDNLTKNIINNIPGNSEGCIQKVKNWSKVMFGAIKIGASNAYKETTERKALNVAHNTYKEGETFLQCFQSNYEGIGAFLGNLFSDDGVTFKNDVWPKIEEHLHGMWDRFFKDIEFNIGNKLDEVSVTQQRQETMIVTQR
ncbi:membrane protein [Wolbachia endosymbiont of Drosophila incompta]|nr:membrane protein [Wolbachia endosymbiont of Drosophila incompta]